MDTLRFVLNEMFGRKPCLICGKVKRKHTLYRTSTAWHAWDYDYADCVEDTTPDHDDSHDSLPLKNILDWSGRRY